jgi:hypothetical protein
MAYTHNGWTLYTRDVKLKGGRNQTIYFFSKKSPKSGKPCEIGRASCRERVFGLV